MGAHVLASDNLREIWIVPVLTREGEADLARRIERGKLAVLKSISRTPLVATTVIALGDQRYSGDRTIRELVSFDRECRAGSDKHVRTKPKAWPSVWRGRRLRLTVRNEGFRRRRSLQ
jgi:sigma-70-like protein